MISESLTDWSRSTLLARMAGSGTKAASPAVSMAANGSTDGSGGFSLRQDRPVPRDAGRQREAVGGYKA